MPEWQGKSKGNKLGYSIFVVVCRYLGVYPAYFLLYFVAFYYFLFSRISSKAILNYFQRRHGFNFWKSYRFLYRNYYLFGQTILDKIIVMAGIQNKFSYHFDGKENLEEMVRRGKGGILISAHVGNWEIAGHFLAHLKTAINIVMYDGEHQKIKSYLEQITGGKTYNVIVIRNDISHIYEISEALQRNELVCLHADRFQEGNRTENKIFLGKEAEFPLGPFVLAYTFKVPVSLVFAFKESKTHYHFFGSKLMEVGNDKDQAITNMMDRFITTLEEKVRRYPEQWFNYYNFWAE